MFRKRGAVNMRGKAHLRDPIINGGITNQNRSEKKWT
jgi:hypothetical protein